MGITVSWENACGRQANRQIDGQINRRKPAELSDLSLAAYLRADKGANAFINQYGQREKEQTYGSKPQYWQLLVVSKQAPGHRHPSNATSLPRTTITKAYKVENGERHKPDRHQLHPSVKFLGYFSGSKAVSVRGKRNDPKQKETWAKKEFPKYPGKSRKWDHSGKAIELNPNLEEPPFILFWSKIGELSEFIEDK